MTVTPVLVTQLTASHLQKCQQFNCEIKLMRRPLEHHYQHYYTVDAPRCKPATMRDLEGAEILFLQLPSLLACQSAAVSKALAFIQRTQQQSHNVARLIIQYH